MRAVHSCNSWFQFTSTPSLLVHLFNSQSEGMGYDSVCVCVCVCVCVDGGGVGMEEEVFHSKYY